MKLHFEPDLDYHPDSRTWEDFWRGSASASLSYPTWSHDGRAIYGLSLDQGAVFQETPP